MYCSQEYELEQKAPGIINILKDDLEEFTSAYILAQNIKVIDVNVNYIIIHWCESGRPDMIFENITGEALKDTENNYFEFLHERIEYINNLYQYDNLVSWEKDLNSY